MQIKNNISVLFDGNILKIIYFVKKISQHKRFIKLLRIFSLRLEKFYTDTGRLSMIKFNDKAIAEAAYYIWQNNGCPANTSAQDWDAAIHQLNAMSALKTASKKLASSRVIAAKKSVARAASLKSASFKATVLNPSSSKLSSSKNSNNSKLSNSKKLSKKSK